MRPIGVEEKAMWRNVVTGGLVIALIATLGIPVWADVFESQQAIDLTINDSSFSSVAATRLRLKYSSGEERYNTLIRFDNLDLLVPLEGMQVDSASLTLTWREENLEWSPASIDVYKLNKSWSEANATWDEADTGVLWDEPGAAGTDRNPFSESLFMGNRFFISIFDRLNYTDSQQFEVELNPDWVQEWIENPELNYGMVVTMNHAAGTDVTFTSDDDFTDPDAAPLLTVVTSPEEGNPPPAAPTALIATADSSEQITLEWTDNAVDEDGFEIERSTEGIAGAYTALDTVGPDTEVYVDGSLDPKTEYCYRVRAINADGESDYADSMCETTLAANLCPHVFAADFNADCYVNGEDLAMMIAEWGTEEGGVTNLDADPQINYGDYALFAQEYLQCGAMSSDMDYNCIVDYLDYALLADADLATLLILAEDWLISCDPQTGICTEGGL